jgi:IS30 family transposase
MEKKKYTQLSLTEREKVSILKAQNKSIRQIAEELGRDPSTISRELRRNAPAVHKGYYLGHKAHERVKNRQSQAHKRKLLKNDVIVQYVEQKLQIGWSPEQIAGRISKDHPALSISYEAVYQYIYKERIDLIPSLPRHHNKRQKRGHSRKHRKSHIPNRISIDARSNHIENRRQIGHWEADTMVSRQSKSALAVIVERKSRLTVIEKLKQKTAQETKNSTIKRLAELPPKLRKSITYDNGSENTEHEQINAVLGTVSYFCNPYHSWEKGTVENTIGLIRRFFPKKTDFGQIGQDDVEIVEFLLNNRPRKCLNFLTPHEMIKQCVALKD